MNTVGTPAVLVMAKMPRPGAVKTRLHSLLGPHRCALLQAELIRHTVDVITVQGCRTYLAYAADSASEAVELRLPVPAGVRVLHQRGDDLGQRLTAGVTEAFADGAGPLLVIGTDAPTLTGTHLAAAFAALSTADVVFGPALDGGYYLIGLRTPQRRLFGIDPAWWGTGKVLAATLALARSQGLSIQLLDPLRDLDTPEDAAALRDDPHVPGRIAALLNPVEARWTS